ncbi:Nucleolar pre-ribosomal-associated protein 1, partial [Habropoda laboriosa]
LFLLRILTQYPEYQTEAERACHHLINSHLSLIHSMMSAKSNVKQRKIILQLLAVIVSLGGTLPRELLSHLALPPELVKSFVQHTKPTDDQNIRNCFIHFILAFLIEGSVPVIRSLLDKQHLLSSIFPDLIYDSKDIVALILTTLKTYVLHNSNVSKTVKLQIFSIPVIQNLVYLYNWKGPNNWSKHKTQNVMPNSQYHEEKLDRPWEYEKPSNLVIKIMTVCPDLIKSQYILLEPYIEPRVSVKWIIVIKFVREVNNLHFLSYCLMFVT